MQEIVDWLKTVEQLACDLYREASVFFEEDKELSGFLDRLAEDEAWHFHLMGSAADYLRQSEIQIASAIILDHTTRGHIETPLKRAYNALLEQTLSKENMIETVLEVEFSELNDIFLYAINTMKEYSKAFQHVAAAVQAHKNRIERFLDILPDGLKPVGDIRELPTVWQNKFLVVDDAEQLRNFLSDLLGSLGAVETARHGKEALEKTRENFFNVIISDVDMPIMDGMEFYRRAVKEDPAIQSHFLFYSGGVTPEREEFFKKNNLRYLTKPCGLDKIIQAVDNIIQTTNL